MKKILSKALVVMASAVLWSAASVQAATPESGNGTIIGQIGIQDVGPMMGGTVFFYDLASGPPSATRYWRVPTYSFGVDENARFAATVPAGKYYMSAMERASGEQLGPPQEGDFFFILQDKKGRARVVTVKKNKVLDMGVINEAAPFKRSTIARKGITAVEGTIRNEKGEPVAGVAVFAFSGGSMAGNPLFVSDKSDKDGKYRLRVSGQGKYYLRARTNYGGPPSAGEVVGLYKNGKPVFIQKAQIKKGADIMVRASGPKAP